MPIYAVDFETFWDSKDYTLSKMGPIEYIRDKRFTPQMMSVQCVDDPGQPYVWDNIKDRATVRHALEMLEMSPNVSWCGHNMHGFDALIFSEHYGFHPHRILDTICMARWCGLARLGRESHEALTEMLGHGKKKAGTVVSNGKRWPDDFTPEEQAFFKQYCADDTSQCAANAAAMLPYMTDDALRFMSITARMATEPMFELDEEMLEGYIRELDAAAEKSRQELLGMFHFPDMASFLAAIRSSDRFAVMLRALGIEPPMKVSEAKTKTYFGKLQAQADAGSAEAAQALANAEPVMTYAFSKTDLDFLDLLHSDDPRVSLLVQTRLEHNSSIARSRAVTLLKFARDKRPVPVMLSTWKAATGRYSAGVSEGASDALQFQNLSKRDPSKLTLRRAIKAPKGRCIVAVDSSQVEARCLAFVAKEMLLVQQFAQGRDPYAELAEVVFGVPAKDIHDGAKAHDPKMKMYRNVGKKAILSAGYGVGARKFSDTLLRDGVRMSDDLDKHREMAFNAHAVYRAQNPNIVALWRTCERVIQALVNGESGQFGGPNDDLFSFGVIGVGPRQDILVPSVWSKSGYILRYPNLRCEYDGGSKPQYFYDRPRGKNLVKTKIYGGSLTENIIQSFAFVDILMWQGCRMDEHGVPLAANIHDCWAAVPRVEEAEATLHTMEYWMSQVPAYAAGLPIACEGEIGYDFTVV